MLLKKALETHKKSAWKKDILEFLWFKIKKDFCENDFYKQKAKKLPKWKYFISDLDGTFFRWTLIKESFSIFIKYFKETDLENIDIKIYKEFLDDLKLFKSMERDAYNKKIAYIDYLNAWLFIVYKYQKYINWQVFLDLIKSYFNKKEKVNPYRFSMSKLKEVLESGHNFLFVSWASSFIFEIYLELLKNYIIKNIWEQYRENIFWFSSLENLQDMKIYDLWTNKKLFIKQLKEKWYLENIIWAMWDTNSDFGIAHNLEENTPFYFINPAKSVLIDFEKQAKSWVDFHFIAERKDLIFEFKKEDIKIID